MKTLLVCFYSVLVVVKGGIVIGERHPKYYPTHMGFPRAPAPPGESDSESDSLFFRCEFPESCVTEPFTACVRNVSPVPKSNVFPFTSLRNVTMKCQQENRAKFQELGKVALLVAKYLVECQGDPHHSRRKRSEEAEISDHPAESRETDEARNRKEAKINDHPAESTETDEPRKRKSIQDKIELAGEFIECLQNAVDPGVGCLKKLILCPGVNENCDKFHELVGYIEDAEFQLETVMKEHTLCIQNALDLR